MVKSYCAQTTRKREGDPVLEEHERLRMDWATLSKRPARSLRKSRSLATIGASPTALKVGRFLRSCRGV